LRIFPEGAAEWLEPVGKTFCIIAAFAVVVGFVWFVHLQYIWHKWPTTDGIVSDSRLVTSKDDNGTTLCSASYRVQYSVNGTEYTYDDYEHVSSSDCAEWKSKVSSAKGTHRTVLYDPENPKDVYVNPGYNFNFFGLPFWCLCFSVVFTFAGLVAWGLGSNMERRGVHLP